MRFNYQARTRTGELKIGQIDASNYEAALEVLQKYGYFVTFLEQFKEKTLLTREFQFFRRIGKKDIVVFTRQLAILLSSQTPPVEALHTLASQYSKINFKDKILKIAADIEGGTSFSNALKNYPKLFSNFYINIIKSGEVSGNLPKALNTLADHLEKEHDLLAKIIASAFYPVLVLIIAIILFGLMIHIVFPRFEEIFLEAGHALPAITLFMLNFAQFLREWGLALLFVVLGGCFFLWRWFKTPKGREVLDQFIVDFPITRSFARKIYLVRFAENLSTLILGGIPIAQALEVSGNVVGNSVYQKIIFETRDKVRGGESISSVLKKYPKLIPPLVSQIIFVGERTGQLDKTLARLSIFYKKEVDTATDKFISLFEPLLIVFLGIGVAIIALTILAPVYQIGLM